MDRATGPDPVTDPDRRRLRGGAFRAGGAQEARAARASTNRREDDDEDDAIAPVRAACAGSRPSDPPARRSSRRPGPVRSAQRARCVRRRLHRPHEGREVARHRRRRAGDAGEPDPSRRGGRRPADGRRRGHAGADPAHLLRRRDGRAGRGLARRGRLCGGPSVHAAGRGSPRPLRRHHRRGRGRRGRRCDRHARRAGRQCVPVQGPRHRGERAGACAGLLRQAGRARRRCVRAAAVHPAQGDLQPRLWRDRRPRQRLLHGLDVLAHDRLQGHVPGLPARRLL